MDYFIFIHVFTHTYARTHMHKTHTWNHKKKLLNCSSFTFHSFTAILVQDLSTTSFVHDATTHEVPHARNMD